MGNFYVPLEIALNGGNFFEGWKFVFTVGFFSETFGFSENKNKYSNGRRENF